MYYVQLMLYFVYLISFSDSFLRVFGDSMNIYSSLDMKVVESPNQDFDVENDNLSFEEEFEPDKAFNPKSECKHNVYVLYNCCVDLEYWYSKIYLKLIILISVYNYCKF